MDNTSIWDKTWLQKKNIKIDEMSIEIYRYLQRYVDFDKKSVLELGCGAGRLSFLIAQNAIQKMILVDSSSRALERARSLLGKRSNITFVKSDLFQLDLSEKFDIVISSGVIEHFKKERLKECIKKHIQFSKENVILIAPSSPHWNDFRVRMKSTLAVYGWQAPISKRQIREIINQTDSKVVVLKRFSPLYGLPKDFVKILKAVGIYKVISTILRPLERSIGGLLFVKIET
ncbi:hypothetical protein DRQ15_07795 [candidate division KSB1 bacterium]|nr:MAG: hypothetical protein DRQ15_07795 [candidate division KSB1 bacterium]